MASAASLQLAWGGEARRAEMKKGAESGAAQNLQLLGCREWVHWGAAPVTEQHEMEVRREHF